MYQDKWSIPVDFQQEVHWKCTFSVKDIEFRNNSIYTKATIKNVLIGIPLINVIRYSSVNDCFSADQESKTRFQLFLFSSATG